MNLNALLSKHWKKEELDLCPGQHFIDEEITVRISGKVVKLDDQMIAPTVSIPLVTTLALFWEKAGLNQDKALELLKEALIEAMDNKRDEDQQIKRRIDDVENAIKAVKEDLISQLPKMPRTGKVVTKDLSVSICPVRENELVLV